MHVRSLVDVPLALTYVPAAQVDQFVQVEAFAVVENAPLAQAVHTRLAVVLPAVETYSPGWHVVHEVHGVAEFASLSHVPLAQADLAVVPPAQ